MHPIVIGNTTIYLWPIFLVFALTMVGVIIRWFWLSIRIHRVVKTCQSAQYSESILIATKLLNYYERAYKALKSKNAKVTIDVLNLYLAISYYGCSDSVHFIKHISLIDDTNIQKHFWLALFNLLEYDCGKFQHYYDVLTSKRQATNYLAYLNAIQLYEEGKNVDAKEIMRKLYPELKFVLLKDIAQKIIE